ncbi:MAG: hypothetical protein KBB55_04330 [Candidatus Buchananbacteria bacterium]|nr:hypothetical protein [Candidatus Buchananbacteria bacterium]
MKQNLENLTDKLIGERGYARIFSKMPFPGTADTFIETVRQDLTNGGLNGISAAELGPVLEEIEKLEQTINVGRDEIIARLCKPVAGPGSATGIFRDLVAICLAIVIRKRFEGAPGVPPYTQS